LLSVAVDAIVTIIFTRVCRIGRVVRRIGRVGWGRGRVGWSIGRTRSVLVHEHGEGTLEVIDSLRCGHGRTRSSLEHGLLAACRLLLILVTINQ
jgi:hypothetical protein